MDKAVLQRRRKLAAYAVVLCVAGLGVALHLFVSHLTGLIPSICEAGEHVSCNKVLASPYARVFNTPVSVLGVGYFIIALGFALFLAGPRHDDEEVAVAFFLYVVIGVASCVWFIYAEWLIGALCPLCTLVHVVCFALLPLAWMLYRLVAPSFSFRPMALVQLVISMHMWALFALLVIGTPIVWVNVMAIQQPRYEAADLEQLGRCLNAAGVMLYSKGGCPYCEGQKRILGPALKHFPVSVFLVCKHFVLHTCRPLNAF